MFLWYTAIQNTARKATRPSALQNSTVTCEQLTFLQNIAESLSVTGPYRMGSRLSCESRLSYFNFGPPTLRYLGKDELPVHSYAGKRHTQPSAGILYIYFKLKLVQLDATRI